MAESQAPQMQTQAPTPVTPPAQRPRMPPFLKALVLIGAALFILAFGFVLAVLNKTGSVTFNSAYVISGDSMCPTICKGERILADSNAYHSAPVQGGDVIVFRYKSQDVLVKRVIGVGGDTISSTDKGGMLVNGQPLSVLPPPCGSPVMRSDDRDYTPNVDPVVVPPREFFVIGDNMPNSNDSRAPGFGTVKQHDVLGKPVMIYWSPGSDRFGCKIQ
jgi:signal peptidase I